VTTQTLRESSTPTLRGTSSIAWFGGLTLTAAIGVAWLHPQWPQLALLLTFLCFFVTWNWPSAFSILFPSALVFGDLYPWTGQLLFQESDYLLLASTAAWLLGVHHRQLASGPLVTNLVWWLPWWLSLALATVIGYAALPSHGHADQLSFYFSTGYMVRIIKGSLWGALFTAYFLCYDRTARRLSENTEETPVARRLFAAGMRWTCLLVCGMLVLERLVFHSLMDFDQEFRATGPFHSMHIGDQYLDAFLVLAFPFLRWNLARLNSSIACWGAFAELSLFFYAIAATMSRATILAAFIQLTVAGWLNFRDLQAQGPRRLIRYGLSALAGTVLVTAGIWTIGNDSAFAQRFQTIRDDWQSRWQQWISCIFDPDRSLVAHFLGNGIGTYPQFQNTKLGRPIPPLQWSRQADQGCFKLAENYPIYLQWVLTSAWDQAVRVRCRLKIEPGDHDTIVAVQRSEKSLLHSFRSVLVPITCSGSGEYCEVDVILPSPRKASEARWDLSTLRPQTVSFSWQSGSSVQLKQVEIVDTQGNSIIGPGSSTSSPWIFTSDDLKNWRTNNAGVQILFEQGVLGLAAFLLLSIAMVRGTADCRPRSNQRRIASLALSGFIVIASFGTLVDNPAILGLYWAILRFPGSSPELRPTT
jgi:hypothetical protein